MFRYADRGTLGNARPRSYALINNPDANWPYPAMLAATRAEVRFRHQRHSTGKDAFHGDVPWYVMLRDKRYKYVRPLIHDLEELYDLQEDPEELKNLAARSRASKPAPTDANGHGRGVAGGPRQALSIACPRCESPGLVERDFAVIKPARRHLYEVEFADYRIRVR